MVTARLCGAPGCPVTGQTDPAYATWHGFCVVLPTRSPGQLVSVLKTRRTQWACQLSNLCLLCRQSSCKRARLCLFLQASPSALRSAEKRRGRKRGSDYVLD